MSVLLPKTKMHIGRHASMIALLIIGSLSPALPETPTQQQPQPAASVKLAPPHIADLPDDDNGKQILLGRRLLADTKMLLPENVGDALNCNSCHLNDGRVALAAFWRDDRMCL